MRRITALRMSLVVLLSLALLGLAGYWDPKVFVLVFLSTLGVFVVPFFAMVLLDRMLRRVRILRPPLSVEEFEQLTRGDEARPCSRCGYDLRASPDRCPECGAVAEAPHNQPMTVDRAGG